MFSFKNYVLLKETATDVQFLQNPHMWLEKLPKEFVVHFIIQLAEKVLHVWEEDAMKNDDLMSHQQSAPRRAIEAAKTGRGDDAQGAAGDIIGATAAGIAGGLVNNAAYVAYYAACVVTHNYAVYHAGNSAIHYALASKGITPKEVYEIYLKLLKTQNTPFPPHVRQLIQAVLMNPKEDTPRMVLADALDELDIDSDHKEEWDKITAHLRDNSFNWTPNDWIFKHLITIGH